MPLPTKKTEPQADLKDMPILIYGKPKIGKSTFASQAEDALFLATEAGLNHLSVYEMRITSWEDLVKAYEDVRKGDHRFKTIVIDTIDNAYAFCLEHFCKKYGMDHPSDQAYGKGWALVNGPFKAMLNRFALLPYGFIMISHEREKELTTRTGPAIKITPSLSGSILETVTSFAEMILYFTVEEGIDKEGNPSTRRIIRTRPAKNYEAGKRGEQLPDPLDLDFNAFLSALKPAVKEATKK